MASNDFVNNIQSIAKTPELETKVNKLILDFQAEKKSPIEEQRIIGFLDAVGATNVAQGATTGTNSTSGTGNDGNPVEGPAAPPPDLSAIDNAVKAATDALIQSLGLNNIQKSANSASSNASNDLSTKATDPTSMTAGGTGGSQFADQGLLGENNPDWQNIKNAMIARGATDDEIKTARMQFLKKALGIDEIGDVVKGDAGPKPDNGNINGVANAVSPQPTSEVLNGVVGVSATDHALALLVRFDSAPIKPTSFDATLAEMNFWPDDPTIAPVIKSYIPGSYWKILSGVHSIYGQTFEDIVSQRESLDNTTCYAIVGGLVSSLTPHVGDLIQFGASGHNVGDSSGSVGGTQYTQQVGGSVGAGKYGTETCSGGDPGSVISCDLPPPLEPFWPKTGVGALQFKDGKFLYSEFDSEIPFDLKGEHSTMVMHSLVTGQDYNIEPAANGGFIISDTAGADGYFVLFNADRTLSDPIPNQFFNFYKPRKQ